MENQNSNQSPADASEEAAATKNGGNATQEVSSTTENVELTKRSLRVQTWRKMRDNKVGVRYLTLFNRIPGFQGHDKAGENLAETEEFKKADHIKVLIDRPLYAAKMQTLLADKNLYLPSTRELNALYLRVEVPKDATPEQKAEVLNIQNVEKHRTKIYLKDKVVLDMVIIGSVIVSRDGYRIGRGNGFTDLDIGLLCEVGSITDKTVIATMVHDDQVVDTLPAELFQKYDAPVDLIITPTQVIRVEKRLPRPAGIFWELLSERRLKIIPVLQELKESQESEGKVIALKEEDTDVEQNARRRRFFPRRIVGGYRRYQRRPTSQSNGDQQQGGENQQRRNAPRRRFANRRRRPTKSEGDQSGVDSKSQDRKSVTDGGNNNNNKPKSRKRMTRDFSVKLSNITRDARIRDLKIELRNRQCNPMAITWKGQYGRCYLHFGHRKGETSNEEDMKKVLEALEGISLTISKPVKNAAKTNANGEAGDGAAGDAGDAGGEQQGKENQTETEAETADAAAETADAAAETADAAAAAAANNARIIILKVELVKRKEKKSIIQEIAEARAIAAAKGLIPPGPMRPPPKAQSDDASSARIESVDTTTV